MKCTSLVRLLEVFSYLYQKQSELKKIFHIEFEYLQREQDLILLAILNDMGFVQGDVEYKQLRSLAWKYCEGQLPKEEVIAFIESSIKVKGVQVVNGSIVSTTNSINHIFEVSHSVGHQKKKMEALVGGECDFLSIENKILKDIILDELGKKRYF